MQKAKEKAAAPVQAAPETLQEQEQKPPERQFGRLQLARSQAASSSLPPPDGGPSLARAGSMVSNRSSGIGTSNRAGMANTLQRQAGNLRMGNITGTVQRKDANTGIQSQPMLQFKLLVNQPGDAAEKEADRIADQITRSPNESVAKDETVSPQPQIKIMEKPAQETASADVPVSNEVEGQIENARPNGKPLQPMVQRQMEAGFNTDFSQVHVHDDEQSAKMAETLKARAFTTRSDIFFGKGEYQPESSSGQKLLAHELTHTVQQGASESKEVYRQPVEASEDVTSTIESTRAESPQTDEMRQSRLAERSSELERQQTDSVIQYGRLYVEEDTDYQTLLNLKFEIARIGREKLVIDTYFWNPTLYPDAADVLIRRAGEVSQSEEWTLTEILGSDTTSEDYEQRVTELLLQNSGLFPDYTMSLYQAATEEFQQQAEDYHIGFENGLNEILSRPIEQLIPDFVWFMEHHSELRSAAQLISFASFLHPTEPIMLQKREPNATQVGIGDLRLHANFIHLNWHTWLHPDLNERLGFLYPLLQDWYFYQFYQRLATEMEWRTRVVGATYSHINDYFGATMPDVGEEINTILSSRNPQVLREDMSAGVDEAYTIFERHMDQWVSSLSWYERIYYAFGLYDTWGEVGHALMAMVSLEAILLMVGFIGFLIAIQFVPFANIVVDAILIALDIVAVLEFMAIFAMFFDEASDATTFRSLYTAAQSLRGAGEKALNVMMTLIGLGVSKAISRYARYRRARAFNNIDEIAEHDVIREGSSEVRSAYQRARAGQQRATAWEETLGTETRSRLQGNAELRRFWAEMDEGVRRLLTRCGSSCIPDNLDPDDVRRIRDFLKRHSIPDNHRGLREYFHVQRDNISNAVQQLDEVQSRTDLNTWLDNQIAARTRARTGVTPRRGPDGRWEYRKGGEVIREFEIGDYGTLSRNRGTDSFFQAHHGIQNAWARDRFPSWAGYSREGAKALLLRSRNVADGSLGTPHGIVNTRQLGRSSSLGDSTYSQQRTWCRQDLRDVGVPEHEITQFLQQADQYFADIYRTIAQRAPDRLNSLFGRWRPRRR